MRKSAEPVRWPWVVFTFLVVGASLTSPWTAARKVRVVGAPPGDQARIEAILSKIRPYPWKLLNTSEVISQVQQEPSVDSARYEGNIFGRGILTVLYRVPVARVGGKADLLLDKKGQLFRGKTILSGLPTFVFPVEVQGPSTTIANGFDLAGSAYACRLLRDRLPNYSWTVELDQRSVLFLTSGTGTRVILGPPEDLEKKIDKLAAVYASSNAFTKVKEINLVVPGQAVFTP